MDFIHTNNQKFLPLWSKFIKDNSHSTWSYLPKRLEFYRYYSKKYRIDDLSFIIIHDNEPICICPLFFESDGEHNSFTYSGSYLKAPLFNDRLSYKVLKKVKRLCFEKIDQLASLKNISKTMLSFDPLSNQHSYNILLEHGYLEASTNTAIIDLSRSQEEIWPKFRKSYQKK